MSTNRHIGHIACLWNNLYYYTCIGKNRINQKKTSIWRMEWFIVCKSFNFDVIRIFILCRLNYTRDWEGNKLRTCQSRFALCSNYLHLAKGVLLHLRLKSPLSRFCLCRICLKLAVWFSRFFIKCLSHWWLLKTIHIVHVQTHFLIL